MNTLERVKLLVSPIKANCLEKDIFFRVEHDCKNESGRIFIQCIYTTPCTVTGELKEWHGRKWYLSDYMTEDEIIKTCYAAYKATVEHEIMEGFTYNGLRLFNPHVSYEALLSISGQEVYRKQN